MRWSYAVVVLILVPLAGCATTPQLTSKAAFSEQVLTRIAQQQADTIIEELQANPGRGHGALNSLLTILGHPYIAGGLTALHTYVTEKQRQDLESQRKAIRADLLAAYQKGTKTTDSYFAVCIQGKERRYGRQAGFPRLDDGPGPCPLTPVTLND